MLVGSVRCSGKSVSRCKTTTMRYSFTLLCKKTGTIGLLGSIVNHLNYLFNGNGCISDCLILMHAVRYTI